MRYPFRFWNTYLTIILLLCGYGLYAQTDEEVEEQIFNSVLTRQFTKILMGTTARPGNYAGLDIKEAKLNGSGSAKITDKSILSFNVNGGITEGISALFNNSKVSVNVGFQVRYNMMSPFGKKASITRTEEKQTVMPTSIRMKRIRILSTLKQKQYLIPLCGFEPDR